jgi:nucleotide-binding universal stress UspA family protein
MLAIQTILHPTDFSDRSLFAFRLACALARDYQAHLIVLHVAPLQVLGAVEGVVLIPPENQREALEEELHRLQPPNPGIHVEHRLVQGEPVPEILEVAGQTKADLIVMGTHGRTGLSRLLMGSVAEQVVRNAPCPVLIVRTPFPQGVPSEELLAEPAGV